MERPSKPILNSKHLVQFVFCADIWASFLKMTLVLFSKFSDLC